MDCMNCIVQGPCFRLHQSRYSSLSALGGLSQLLLPCRSFCCPRALLMTHGVCTFTQREQRQGKILSPSYVFSVSVGSSFTLEDALESYAILYSLRIRKTCSDKIIYLFITVCDGDTLGQLLFHVIYVNYSVNYCCVCNHNSFEKQKISLEKNKYLPQFPIVNLAGYKDSFLQV